MTGHRRVEQLLVVGDGGPHTVGAHLIRAGNSLGLRVRLCDYGAAERYPLVLRAAFWRLGGRRPVCLHRFGREVVAACEEAKPDLVLVTGQFPPGAAPLRRIRALGIPVVNFLTDDPWNPTYFAPWFHAALRGYSFLFTPRDANLAQLAALGPRVGSLSFAYCPEVHQPTAEPVDDAEGPDLLFVGGADPERVRFVRELARSGLSLALYGQYWDRDPELKRFARGFADLATQRRETARAKCVLGLVREANRDGHSMRTHEVPAMRGLLLAQCTPQHEAIFGPRISARCMFSTAAECANMVRELAGSPAARAELRAEQFDRITGRPNTYADRLREIIDFVSAG